MCTNGAVTAPAFTAPADSASVTYSEPVTAETGAGVTSAEPTKAADAPVTKLPSTGTGAGNGTSMLITGALGAMAIAMLASGVIRSQKQRS